MNLETALPSSDINRLQRHRSATLGIDVMERGRWQMLRPGSRQYQGCTIMPIIILLPPPAAQRYMYMYWTYASLWQLGKGPTSSPVPAAVASGHDRSKVGWQQLIVHVINVRQATPPTRAGQVSCVAWKASHVQVHVGEVCLLSLSSHAVIPQRTQLDFIPFLT